MFPSTVPVVRLKHDAAAALAFPIQHFVAVPEDTTNAAVAAAAGQVVYRESKWALEAVSSVNIFVPFVAPAAVHAPLLRSLLYVSKFTNPRLSVGRAAPVEVAWMPVTCLTEMLSNVAVPFVPEPARFTSSTIAALAATI
jgi:hypothetical protein